MIDIAFQNLKLKIFKFSPIRTVLFCTPQSFGIFASYFYMFYPNILLYNLRFSHRNNFLRPGLLSTLFHGIFFKIIQRIIADKLRIHPLLSVIVLGIQNSFHVMKCTKVGKQPTAYGPNQGHHLFLQVKSYWNIAMFIC